MPNVLTLALRPCLLSLYIQFHISFFSCANVKSKKRVKQQVKYPGAHLKKEKVHSMS